MITVRHRGLRGDRTTARVTFTLPHDQPRGTVSVVGDFNDWDPALHILTQGTYGTRSITLTLPRGHTYAFRYVTEDGHEFTDPDTGNGDADEGGDENISVVTT